MPKRLLAVCLALLLTGCAANDAASPSPSPAAGATGAPGGGITLPEKFEKNAAGVPVLSVYVTDDGEARDMDIETYLMGVVAGEMRSDWPMEALKAQAILARTFVLKFCAEKQSKYENADISTDIEEAQAYDAAGVNERVEQAVAETAGMVLSHGGELPYAWFHAHSGGTTALAREGLGYDQAEPGYTQVVKGNESDSAPEDAREWSATFTAAEFIDAAEKAGAQDLGEITALEVAGRGESGRATVIKINNQSVSASELRIALGSERMRSTLLTSLKLSTSGVEMAGKGFGHGVGMPQWGAYAMAEEGKTAGEIVTYYFKDVTVEKAW